MYFITGTADKESWEGCHGQVFCIIYSPVFFIIIYVFYFIMSMTPMRDCVVQITTPAHRPTFLAISWAF